MGEDTILASVGVGLVPPEMSTYFRALLYYNPILYTYRPLGLRVLKVAH